MINQSTKTPQRTVWLAVVVAFLLGLPLLKARWLIPLKPLLCYFTMI